MKKLQFALLLFAALTNVCLADEPTDQLSPGGRLVAEAFYGPGGVLSSADDSNFDNTSYVVIDWNDSALPVLFGYRWSDPATNGQQMFDDIIVGTQNNPDDEALFGKKQTFVFGGVSSAFLLSAGYDRNGNDDWGNLSDGSTMADFAGSGLVEFGESPIVVNANDSGDSYREGGFGIGQAWEYYIADSNPYLANSSWISPMFGFTGRTLTDDSWDAWNFLTDSSSFGTNADNIRAPAAVAIPEPTSFALLGLAGIAGLNRRRRIAS